MIIDEEKKSVSKCSPMLSGKLSDDGKAHLPQFSTQDLTSELLILLLSCVVGLAMAFAVPENITP